jgi:hypothetical protein
VDRDDLECRSVVKDFRESLIDLWLLRVRGDPLQPTTDDQPPARAGLDSGDELVRKLRATAPSLTWHERDAIGERDMPRPDNYTR